MGLYTEVFADDYSCALTSDRLQRAVEVYLPGNAHSNNGQGDLSLKYSWEMLTLVNQFMSETEAGDFPGRFVCLVQLPAF